MSLLVLCLNTVLYNRLYLIFILSEIRRNRLSFHDVHNERV